MEAITVEIDPEIISISTPGKCDKCVVALAILRAVPGAEDVHVGYDSANWCLGFSSYSATLPFDVGNYMEDFDQGKEVFPIGFRITPEESSPYLFPEDDDE